MHSDTNKKQNIKQYLLQSWALSLSASKGYKIVMGLIFFGSLGLNLSVLAVIQNTAVEERQALWLQSLIDPIVITLICHLLIRPFLRLKVLKNPLRLSAIIKLLLFLFFTSVLYFAINMKTTEMGPLGGEEFTRLQIVTEDGEVDAVVGEQTIWLMGIMNGFSFFIAWSIAYMLWHQHLARKILQKQVHKAQMQQLTNQLSPHFLFNTFNSIRALIYEDQDKAAETVTELSELFRIHMQAHLRSNASLDEEWQVAKRYLDIEQIRLEERLTFYLDIADELWSQSLPTLTLLTLIENAIKHGISPSVSPGFVRISAYLNSAQRWSLKVSNSFKSGLDTSGTKVGLSNIKKRLDIMYPGNYEVSEQIEQETFTLVLTLPLKASKDKPHA